MSKGPANYQFSDQFARLEATRAYLKGASTVLNEAVRFEGRNVDVSYLRRDIAHIAMGIITLSAQVDELMGSMETDLAIENGSKETVYPPPQLPGAVRIELNLKQAKLPLFTELTDAELIETELTDTSLED